VKRLPKSTKANHSHVPRPQQERIVSKFIQGRGIRQIAREERRSRETVTKIVRSEDVQKYVAELREQYIGLGREALAALTRALRSSTDGKLAHQVLVDLDVVHTPAPADAAAQTGAYDEETEVLIMTGRLVQAAAVRAQTYGIPLEKIGHGLKNAAKKLLDRSIASQ
jgi:hypothetical protein